MQGQEALAQWDRVLAAAAPDSELAQLQASFWTNICLCNSLIVEPNPQEGGLPVFQVHPDLVPLHEA